jgi:hypothetical protein
LIFNLDEKFHHEGAMEKISFISLRLHGLYADSNKIKKTNRYIVVAEYFHCSLPNLITYSPQNSLTSANKVTSWQQI